MAAFLTDIYGAIQMRFNVYVMLSDPTAFGFDRLDILASGI